MGTTAMRLLPVRFLIGFAMLASLVCAAGAYAAVAGLPAGVQVNNDPPAIDPGQDAGLTDLTAGTVTAGNARVPWAAFSQKSGASQQIFVRAFKGGAWQTQGFPESLNEDTAQVAQAPSIDFTGAEPDRPVGRLGGAEHRSRKQPSDLREPLFAPARSRSGWRPVDPRGPAGHGHGAVAEHQHEPRRGRSIADRRHDQRGRQSCSMADLAGVRWSAGRRATRRRARRRSSSPMPSRRRRVRVRPAPSRTTARVSATSAFSRSGSTASRVPAPVSSTPR